MEARVTNILFAAAEVAPHAKVGGLADVVGALPKALATQGVDVRVVMPFYNFLKPRIVDTTRVASFVVTLADAAHEVTVVQTALPASAVPLYLLDAPAFFAGTSVYADEVANTEERQRVQVERFLFFARAVAELPDALAWQPDVVHCHDWHTGALPFLLRRAQNPRRTKIATLYTIHNLALQGRATREQWRRFVGTEDGVPIDGDHKIGLTRVGLTHADALSTVSPSYAKEILTPEFGCGFEGVLQQRAARLFGILNGIDVDVWNPATDQSIVQQYDDASLTRKQENTRALLDRFQIAGSPVFGMVSRFTEQKGVSLVVAALPQLAATGAAVVLLGAGDPQLEAAAHQLTTQFPSAVATTLGFNAALAQQIYAGSDCFLMPSRFEPCGLGQMIALRYGTIPIVRAVGGLKDTVTEGDAGDGFVFTEFSSAAFLQACERAIAAFHHPARWRALQQRAMRHDVSWAASARDYLHLYSITRQFHATTE